MLAIREKTILFLIITTPQFNTSLRGADTALIIPEEERERKHEREKERAGGLPFLLVPPPAASAQQDLSPSFGGMVDVPVVTAAGRKGYVADGYSLGGEHIQIALSHKILGKGSILTAAFKNCVNDLMFHRDVLLHFIQFQV